MAEIDIPVGKTALYTCAERAKEQQHPNKLFTDEYAERLAGPTGLELLEKIHQLHEGKRKQAISTSMIIRTKFFDELVQNALSQCGINQIVIVAAGMDTRAYRLNLDPALKVWELDFKQVLEYKSSLLSENPKPTLGHVLLGVDLTKSGWENQLIDAGFEPSEKSLWLVEGLLVYLEDKDIKSLFSVVSRLCANGSMVSGDWMNRSYLESQITLPFRSVFSSLGSPFINGSDDVGGLLVEFEFKTEIKALGESDTNFGERVPLGQVKVAQQYPITDPNYKGIPRHFLFVATKSSGLKSKTIEKKENVHQKEILQTQTKQVFVGTRQKLEEVVNRIICKVLDLTNLDDKKSLFAQGMDSFSAVEVRNLLEKEIQIPLPLELVFQHHSVDAICNFVLAS